MVTRWKRPGRPPWVLEMAARDPGPDLILLDIGLPDASGLEVLTKVKRSSPQIQIIVLTGQDSLSNAIDSIKLGAFHFIGKPYAPEELLSLMQRAFEQQELMRETVSLREEAKELKALLKQASAQMAPVFKNRRMVEIEEFITQIAPSEANVLVTGESGRGQGSRGQLNPRPQPPCRWAARQTELRRVAPTLDRGRTLRLREGGIHRGGQRFPRHDRRLCGRYAVSR